MDLFNQGKIAAKSGFDRVAPIENGFFKNKEWYKGFDSTVSTKQQNNISTDSFIKSLER